MWRLSSRNWCNSLGSGRNEMKCYLMCTNSHIQVCYSGAPKWETCRWYWINKLSVSFDISIYWLFRYLVPSEGLRFEIAVMTNPYVVIFEYETMHLYIYIYIRLIRQKRLYMIDYTAPELFSSEVYTTGIYRISNGTIKSSTFGFSQYSWLVVTRTGMHFRERTVKISWAESATLLFSLDRMDILACG